MQHRASGPEWGRINESILLQGPKTPAIKDKSSRYTLDLDTDWECVWRRGTPQSHSCILQLCSYFGFLIIPRLHLRPSAPESSPPPPPPPINTGCFLEQNRVLLKCVLIHNMDAEDRLRCIFKKLTSGSVSSCFLSLPKEIKLPWTRPQTVTMKWPPGFVQARETVSHSC